MEVDFSDLKTGDYLECFAFALHLDYSESMLIREIQPVKGAIRRIDSSTIKFFPYTKKGVVGSKKMDYYGIPGNKCAGYPMLSLFTTKNETIAAWKARVLEIRSILDKTIDRINQQKVDIQYTVQL